MAKVDELIEQEERAWDYKRILIGLVILSFLGVGIYSILQTALGDNKKGANVLGTAPSRENSPENSLPPSGSDVRLPNEKDVQKILDQAKNNLSQITSDNVTSSQAAIQKIVQDLQQLQGGKTTVQSIFCETVCKK